MCDLTCACMYANAVSTPCSQVHGAGQRQEGRHDDAQPRRGAAREDLGVGAGAAPVRQRRHAGGPRHVGHRGASMQSRTAQCVREDKLNRVAHTAPARALCSCVAGRDEHGGRRGRPHHAPGAAGRRGGHPPPRRPRGHRRAACALLLVHTTRRVVAPPRRRALPGQPHAVSGRGVQRSGRGAVWQPLGPVRLPRHRRAHFQRAAGHAGRLDSGDDAGRRARCASLLHARFLQWPRELRSVGPPCCYHKPRCLCRSPSERRPGGGQRGPAVHRHHAGGHPGRLGPGPPRLTGAVRVV